MSYLLRWRLVGDRGISEAAADILLELLRLRSRWSYGRVVLIFALGLRLFIALLPLRSYIG